MSPILTDTRTLGTLVTEYVVREDHNNPYPVTMYRPTGVTLQNDGNWSHWMVPGETYEVAYEDAHGWRVTCRAWPPGTHIYHLATVRGTRLRMLPVVAGNHMLERGKRYVIAPGAVPSTWALQQVV